MAAETLGLGPVVWRDGARAALEAAAAAPGALQTLRGAAEAAAVAEEVLQWDIRSAHSRERFSQSAHPPLALTYRNACER